MNRSIRNRSFLTAPLQRICEVVMILFLLCLPTQTLAGTVVANVVAIDQFLTFNRMGAVNPTGMIFALRRDVVVHNPGSQDDGLSEAQGGVLEAGKVRLRDDKRPRPITLRVNEGDNITIVFKNLLNPVVPSGMDPVTGLIIDEQPATRTASIHIQGLELAGSIDSDGSHVGRNASSLASPGQTRTYSYHAVRENGYVLTSTAANLGGEGTMGSLAYGLFGMVNVEPTGATWYRSQVTEKEMSMATTGHTDDGHPLINYDAVYPAGHRFAGKPILKILDGNEIYHSDLNAIISNFSKAYPENPTNPNRQEPFREFSAIFHDEVKAIQAFDLFRDPNFEHTLHSVRDGFAINYGTGGVGAEIIANRLGVGPMADCTECKYEEFFLTSWAVGDPAMIVDVPANTIDENRNVIPGLKATKAFYPDDPSNVFHSYMSDHVKIRNTHVGKEHHMFHLHAHQWLANPDDDNSDYLDSQAVGPGSQYTYEIAYNGSGNRNKTAGDSIFHCHFYPHFAQGMWALWRVHDVFESGSVMGPDGIPVAGTRALPDGEIMAGTPIPGLVPLPSMPMAPMPEANVEIVAGQPVITPLVNGDEELGNPGYPFFIPGVAGHRPPTPPLDLEKDGGLPRHIIVSGTADSHETPFDFNKELLTAEPRYLSEQGEPVEQAAMAFHAKQWHATFTPEGLPAMAEYNGLPPSPGSPFAEPCRTDSGSLIATNRTYRAAAIELDISFNKVGWHFNQSRILALEDDVVATLNKSRAPEPLVMRANSGDCIDFFHTNLVPNVYQQDDFQVKTPTDVIGQHIHLVKFDVTSADGSGNGWNYEDGTFSPGEVIERIHAINAYNDLFNPGTPHLQAEPGFNGVLGARTSIQHWYMDPVLNLAGEDRGLGNVFTHDHFGPSTHQQAGLYATLLGEPAGSTWRDTDTGIMMGSRGDGGPTSWNADILAGADSTREFYLEFADFQLAYSTPGLPRAQGGTSEAINPPGMVEVGLPFLLEKPQICPNGAPNVAGCPEAVSAADVGTFVVNYRNEPLPLRVRNPQTNAQASGTSGDLSYAFSSKLTRSDPAMNVQPNTYPPLTADTAGGDPYTPLLRAYDGDNVNLRMQVGATEEGHVVSVHGMKWLQDNNLKNSGYRNAQMMGLSEQFQLIAPVKTSGVRTGDKADYLYSTNSSVDGYWNGSWGLMRTYATQRSDLQSLPNNPISTTGLTITNKRDFREMCPRSAPVRAYDVTAISSTITYNSRSGSGPVQGPLTDPTGIRYVLTSDLDSAGNLLPNIPEEPLILRAAAGECISVTLRSELANLPDLDGFSTLPPIVEHFNANEVRPSTSVGLHPQMVAYDVTRSDGANVGMNRRTQTTKKGDRRPVRYLWYAGDVKLVNNQLVATPIEFGATNLISSDKIKHSSKGAVGALIIEPEGATWELDEGTRASATVYANGRSFREFVTVFQDDINMRNSTGSAIPNVLVENDSEDSGHRGINYKSEPTWLRMGYAPDATDSVTGALDYSNVLSNSLIGGDPQTPVFTAAPGQEVRFRVLQPGGHARNGVFTLYGHAWQKTPYLDESTRIGDNQLSIYMGAQEGTGPANHFDIIPANGAGGTYGITGDYLYRDNSPTHFDNGNWGIFRVE